jgi:hypothetical protein
MDSPFTVEKLLDLTVGFIVVIAFASVGLIALLATSVRVDEARLPKPLAKARMWFAASAYGPLPLTAYWWGGRFVGLSFIVASQAALLRVLTGSGSLYPKGILLPWAIAQWAILLAWSGWVVWAFRRAAGPTGTLPVNLVRPVKRSRRRRSDGQAWTEPTDSRPPEDGNDQG